MVKPYSDAIVVVTGASSGIGRELARQMAPDAKALVLVARREERLEKLAGELREAFPELEVMVRATDLTDLDACGAMLDEVNEAFDHVDVLVNNAGFGDMSAFDLASWDKLYRMIQLNVSALTYLSHRVYPSMVSLGRGGILNISSGFGLETLPSFATYVGSKHYVTGLTECLHAEAKRLGVTVTQVCPGPVATEFEAVAGNFLDRPPPALLEISADKCARQALAGFSSGRAIVIPGFFNRLLMWSSALTARWFKRLFNRFAAGWVRRQELAALSRDA